MEEQKIKQLRVAILLPSLAHCGPVLVAQKIVQTRTNTPLKNLAQVQPLLGTTSELDQTRFGVSTQYFEIRGRLRIDDWVFEEVSLVVRKGIDVTTVWRKRV